MNIRRRLEQAFAEYQLEELLGMTSSQAYELGVLDLSVMAQALSGNLERGLLHFDYSQKKAIRLPEEQWAAIHFALGVAHTRVSKYQEARRHFAITTKWRHSSERSRFFAWQSLGFYSFFTGDYEKSVRAARRALALALTSGFAFGELLAEELLAHSLVESGQVRLGMRHMRHAYKRARELGNKSLQQSFRLLLLLNEARFGLDWECVPRLQAALRDLHPSDAYSRNAVKLELANQLCLRGRLNEAYSVLDAACDSVYSSQNRRQIAQLNLRLAYITAVRGRREEASHLLRAAELQLHRDVDLALWLKMQGVRERFHLPASETRREGRLVGMHGRILQRARGGFQAQLFGDDRLADLCDRVVHKDELVLPDLLENEMFFFLYSYFDLATDQRALVFDLLPRGLLILDHGNIAVVETGFSNVLRRILELLHSSHQSKVDLVNKVWGYRYDSERHDPLVYTSISKLRQLLGASGIWIEMDGKGYRLRSGVQLKSRQGLQVAERTGAVKSRLRPPANLALNFRQLSLLTSFDMQERESCSADEVMAAFAISRATATRDLGSLSDLGYLLRLGQARATRYLRTPKHLEG